MGLFRQIERSKLKVIAQFKINEHDEEGNLIKEVVLMNFHNDFKSWYLVKKLNLGKIKDGGQTGEDLEIMVDAVKDYVVKNLSVDKFKDVIFENYSSNEIKRLEDDAIDAIISRGGSTNPTKAQIWQHIYDFAIDYDMTDEHNNATKSYLEVVEKVNNAYADEVEAKTKKTKKKTAKKSK